MKTEVEIRGPLTDKEYKRVLTFLRKRGKAVLEADQLAIFFRTKEDSLIYKGVQISLKTKAVIGPHFELEVTVDDQKPLEEEKKKLVKIAQGLKLKVWTEEEYRRHTNKMWNAYNPGPQIL